MRYSDVLKQDKGVLTHHNYSKLAKNMMRRLTIHMRDHGKPISHADMPMFGIWIPVKGSKIRTPYLYQRSIYGSHYLSALNVKGLRSTEPYSASFQVQPQYKDDGESIAWKAGHYGSWARRAFGPVLHNSTAEGKLVDLKDYCTRALAGEFGEDCKGDVKILVKAIKQSAELAKGHEGFRKFNGAYKLGALV